MCQERLSYISQHLGAFGIFVARGEFLRCTSATRTFHAASNSSHSSCKARWSSEFAIRNWNWSKYSFHLEKLFRFGRGVEWRFAALGPRKHGIKHHNRFVLGEENKNNHRRGLLLNHDNKTWLFAEAPIPLQTCQCCWKWDTTNQGSREPSVLILSRDALCKIRHQEADGQSTANMLHVRREQLKGHQDFLVSVHILFPWACKHCPHTINVVPKALQQFPPRDLYQTIEVILETENYETNHSLRPQNSPPKDGRPRQGSSYSCTSDPHRGIRNRQDWLRKQ